VKFSAASQLIRLAKKFSGGGYRIQTSAVTAARRKMLYQNNGRHIRHHQASHRHRYPISAQPPPLSRGGYRGRGWGMRGQSEVCRHCPQIFVECNWTSWMVHESELWRNGWFDPDTFWGDERGRSRNRCIRFWWWSSKGKGQFWGWIWGVPL